MYKGVAAGVVVFVATLAGTPSLASEIRPTLKAAFERTARRSGPEYAVSRDYLAQQGRELLPLLRDKSKSGDWQERHLATALILRLEHPQMISLWQRLLQNWHQRFELREDGTVLVTFPEHIVPRLPPEIAREKEIILTRQCLPFVLDKMREIYRGAANGNVERAKCLQVLQLLADAESSHALVTYLDEVYRTEDALKIAIRRLGRDAAPALRKAIRSAPPLVEAKTKIEEIQRRRRYYSTRAAANAAELLADIGDKKSVPLLAERLKISDSSEAIPAFARALARLGGEDAAHVVFDRLVDCVAVTLGSHWDYEAPADYNEVRPAMIDFGERARQVLVARLAKGQPIVERAIATGLLYELDNPQECDVLYRDFAGMMTAGRGVRDDVDLLAMGRDYFWAASRYGEPAIASRVPLALSFERAAALATPSDLTRLAKETKNSLAFKLAAAGLLTNRYNDRGGPSVVTAFAAAGQTKVLPVYEKLLDEKMLTHDPQPIIEAILLLGDPQGARLLRSFRDRWKDDRNAPGLGTAVEVADAILPVVEGKRMLAELLDHKQASIRLVAARRMLREKNLRGLPEVFAAAVSARGAQHVELRDLIVEVGQKAVKPLAARRAQSEDLYAKVLCESIILRIGRPELIDRLNRASWIRTFGFGNIRGPSVADYQAAGIQVAESMKRESMPLIEAALLFETNELLPGIAAFALANFEQHRSIAVLVQSLRNPVVARGQSVTAAVLGEFGEAGLKAAKHIPPPDPKKANYGRRAARHRGGTRVLTNAGDQTSVENILQATKQLREIGESVGDEHYSTWQRRMRAHLEMAATFEDKRLIEAAIRFLEHDDTVFAAPALKLLARYEDERAVPQALIALCTKGKYAEEAALPILVEQLQDTAAQTVLDQLRGAASNTQRLAIVRSMELLIRDEKYWQVGDDPGLMLADARERFQAALIEQLASHSPDLQKTAALALAAYPPHNKAVVAALADWTAKHAAPAYQVINYLVQSGSDEAAAALLAAYRQGGRTHSRLATALGRMKYVKAIDDINLALDKHMKDKPAKYHGVAELESLRSFGEAGLPKIIETLRADTSLHLRVTAAENVLGHKEAFNDVRDLFLEITTRGLNHPDVVRDEDPRGCFRRLTYRLASAFGSLDAERAYPIMAKTVVDMRDDELARPIAQRLDQFRRSYLMASGIDLAEPASENE